MLMVLMMRAEATTARLALLHTRHTFGLRKLFRSFAFYEQRTNSTTSGNLEVGDGWRRSNRNRYKTMSSASPLHPRRSCSAAKVKAMTDGKDGEEKKRKTI